VNYDAQLIGPRRFEAASQREPRRSSAPRRAPSGQGNVRPRREAPVPGGASARSGRGIRRLCVLGAFSVASVVSRRIPLRPLRLSGGHSKSRLARCQQELPGPTKRDRPLQNLHHKSRITNHESRIAGHESPAYALRATAGRPLTSSRFGPRTGIPVRVLCVPDELAGRCFRVIPGHQSLATSHFSNPYTPGNRNHCNSLKTHADAPFYSPHSPGVVQTVFIPKGSPN